jgi:tol-pal system protein YbgF
MREFQYALRRLRSSSTFTIAATLTLASAIGATAAVYRADAAKTTAPAVRWAMAPVLVLAAFARLAAHGAAPATANRDSPQATPTGLGPDELYQLGLRQFWQGHADAARQTFRQLLQQYPSAAVAAGAQFYLAEADEMAGHMAAADSGYQLFVQLYPMSARASEALYKHATILDASDKSDAGKAAFREILNKYPQSDEAVLAKDRLLEPKQGRPIEPVSILMCQTSPRPDHA